MADVALNANGQVADKTDTNKNLRNDVVSAEEVEALKNRHRYVVDHLFFVIFMPMSFMYFKENGGVKGA